MDLFLVFIEHSLVSGTVHECNMDKYEQTNIQRDKQKDILTIRKTNMHTRKGRKSAIWQKNNTLISIKTVIIKDMFMNKDKCSVSN